MRSFPFVCLALMFGALLAKEARGCEVMVTYYVMTTSDSDGSFIGGHWQIGWDDVSCDGGGGGWSGGGGGTSGGGSGGGTYGPVIPPGIVSLHDMYMNECGKDIAYGDFLSEDQYNQTALSQYFPWTSYKNSGSDFVLVDSGLSSGTGPINTCMSAKGQWLPPIGQPLQSGTGYRLPNGGTQTGCKGHALGAALDLSVENPPPNMSPCQFWNSLADCASQAGAYVEPYQMIISNGDRHLHYSFGRPPNSSAEPYGDACNP